MVEKRLELSGSMTHQMETPYGTATLYITGEASRVEVNVRGINGLVMKTRYSRSRYTGTDWKPETNSGGKARMATGWGYTVPKKDRHNMQIVVDALVLAWLKNHEADMVALRVASKRSRAWRMASSANDYADNVRRLASEADTLETGTQPVKEVA
jgi:hypothetical protein